MEDSDKPIFFLSYSIDKALVPKTVEIFIDVLKHTITQDFGCHYLDLLEQDHPGTIHGDLIAALKNCDCLIAEATNAAPNVYFEMGVADALGKPLITFLDRAREAGKDGRPSPRANDIVRIRERFFGKANISDLGDLRYWEYAFDEGEPVEFERQRLKRKQHDVIRATITRFLQPRILGPRRNLQAAFLEGQKAIGEYVDEQPKLWLIDGLSEYSVKNYAELPKPQMQVDESVYESMLKAMGTHMHANSMAIADLQSGLEPFLLTSEPEDVRVGARIFAFDSKQDFERHVDAIWKHSRKYQCYMIDRAYVVRELQHSRLAQKTKASGVNIMCTGETSAWYVRDAHRPDEIGRERLVIDSRPEIRKMIATTFSDLTEKAVDLSALSEANKEAMWAPERARIIRSEWLRRRGIGRWASTWSAFDRDSRYHNDYEDHIRAWIPDYDGLAGLFLDRASRAASEMAQSGKFVVVEAGPGTGEITERVLRRLSESARVGHESRVAEYRLYEKDREMLERMFERGLIGRKNQGFSSRTYEGEGVGASIPVTPKKKLFIGSGEAPAGISHDVLMLGSLVHHYIDVLDCAEPDFAGFFDAVRNRFPTTRQIVLAGVFYYSSPDAQVAEWRQWMSHHGLDDDVIRDFFAGNPEMQRPFMIADIKAAADLKGWDSEDTPVNPHYPFGVLHLRRRKSSCA